MRRTHALLAAVLQVSSYVLASPDLIEHARCESLTLVDTGPKTPSK